MSEIYEQTPSQAEGERDDLADEERGPRGRTARRSAYDPPRTTPSQAEGERGDETPDDPNR
ncbi:MULTISPECIES: hypothetical protein [unclassified Streptomyces]|uniref:hypothetical protein n=1 Tax=unclassified Streptomyces TaxID=2593676 RepID=UPI001F041A11|nr:MULTISPECIES: hypothetical protein [unclassified Streptomyces]MCH0562435.1 hypothetical protein [Streptomyces sp. MUM 2J]MCH0570411.1 hypothetical protein [Streptomyces sp. MUM 136J]